MTGLDLDFADDPRRGCAPGSGVDPDDFFSDRAEPMALARKACRACPFTEACLRRAVVNKETAGIWAGVNMASAIERERAVEAVVRDLWERELSDGDIALRLGRHPGDICKLRKRMGLASRYGPGGRRRTAVPA